MNIYATWIFYAFLIPVGNLVIWGGGATKLFQKVLSCCSFPLIYNQSHPLLEVWCSLYIIFVMLLWSAKLPLFCFLLDKITMNTCLILGIREWFSRDQAGVCSVIRSATICEGHYINNQQRSWCWNNHVCLYCMPYTYGSQQTTYT